MASSTSPFANDSSDKLASILLGNGDGGGRPA
jgi:hypothetical protein